MIWKNEGDLEPTVGIFSKHCVGSKQDKSSLTWSKRRHMIAATKDWHHVALSLLPKKGDLKLPKNYRPISLIDVLCKLLSSVFANRINHHLEKIGWQEHAGFAP